MATVDTLQRLLRERAEAASLSTDHKLYSDSPYSCSKVFVQNVAYPKYQNTVPQLVKLLGPLIDSQGHLQDCGTGISVLEIRPGPASVVGCLPSDLRCKITHLHSFGSNDIFATKLEKWLCSTSKTGSPLSNLQSFTVVDSVDDDIAGILDHERYDLIIFCHSLYGKNLKPHFIEKGLELLTNRSDAMLVVFHRDEALDLGDLACSQTLHFPDELVLVADEDKELDKFASSIAGFTLKDVDATKSTRLEWRNTCRALGACTKSGRGYLFFRSHEVMRVFTSRATKLSELAEKVVMTRSQRTTKNREGGFHQPFPAARPTKVQDVQECVRWALEHSHKLTVLGGGHSGHSLRPNTVSVDMGAFNQVHIVERSCSTSEPDCLVVVESGCKTETIVRKTMKAGVVVPLGSCPSVGAGLWLQGGLGHLTRLYGLASDSIVGAIVVSVESGQILCVGCVPVEHRPVGAIRREDESELLWALKGAGTNFGIVVSVVFKAQEALKHQVRTWVTSQKDNAEALVSLTEFDKLFASMLLRNSSADMYLYWTEDRLHLAATRIDSLMVKGSDSTSADKFKPMDSDEDDLREVDALGLFDTRTYMSGLIDGHGKGKISSFKRCLFLKDIGDANVAAQLVAAMESRPTSLSYLHLLQGGGAVGDVESNATAFGCRDWDFACIITGIWPREKDGTEVAKSVVRWVYKVANDLLALSSGVYGADLGPDSRDAVLATKAFGDNRSRLARLKATFDPKNILAYTCPLPAASMEQKLIILVTGSCGVGKDYCADIWASKLNNTENCPTALAVSISTATKQEYAAATGADLPRLLVDRAYKEEHRSALTAFFSEQVQSRPRLAQEHFLNVVYNAPNVEVLLITGMRDKAPVAAFSHLVPGNRLIEVHVLASQKTRALRRGFLSQEVTDRTSDQTAFEHKPCFVFNNDSENTNSGQGPVEKFAKDHLLPLLHKDLKRLTNMIKAVADFPGPGVEFRHVLGISHQPGGLALCTTLLEKHFAGDWSKVDAIVSCEAGGWVFASALASRVNVPLVLIREEGKLPPPTLKQVKSTSHISSLTSDRTKEKSIEIQRDAIAREATVMVVDDVLATGHTLCSALQLLAKAGIDVDSSSVMVVTEFPIHRGRELVRECGFGSVRIQSLLVLDGH